MQKLSLETLNVNGLLDEEGHKCKKVFKKMGKKYKNKGAKKYLKKCYGVAMYAWLISDTMHKILFSPKGQSQLLKNAVCPVTGIFRIEQNVPKINDQNIVTEVMQWT